MSTIKRDRGPDSFFGVRFGMSRKEAIAVLRTQARDQLCSVEKSGAFSGSVYFEGPIWTLYLSVDDQDFVDRVGMWRKTPAGRKDGIEWIASRIRAYGPPDLHLLLAPREGREHESQLEWSGGSLRPSITFLHDEEWNVREDWTSPFSRKQPTLSLKEYRSRVDRLLARLAHARQSLRPVEHAPYVAFIDKTSAWVTARRDALHYLEPLVGAVPLIDLFEVLDQADRLLTMTEQDIAAGVTPDDGAFLVMNRREIPEGADSPPVLSKIFELLYHQLPMSTGVVHKQLTCNPGHSKSPVTREPLPEPPGEVVHFLAGPFAARLLREHILPLARESGTTCRVYPASFGTLSDVREEQLRIPPAADDFEAFKYRPIARPLRILHQPSGTSVYLNVGGTLDEIRTFAHALLAAKLKYIAAAST